MRKFFQTVAIVSVFSVSEKVLGFLYRIYLSHSIGAEGIGLYSVALSVFGLLYTLCCAGIPITVSRLMTQDKAQKQPLKVRKIITAGILLPLMLAIPVTLAFYLSSPRFPENKEKPHRGGCGFFFIGDPLGTRTPDPLLKRQLLYRLS